MLTPAMSHRVEVSVTGAPRLPLVRPCASKCQRRKHPLWVTSAATSAELGTLHNVQTGQTLAQVALAYGVSTGPKEDASRGAPVSKHGARTLLTSDTAVQNVTPRPDAVAAAASALPSYAPIAAGVAGGLLLLGGLAKALRGPQAAAAAPQALSDAAPAAPPPVATAVAEVRALLQDVDVEMDAVESALMAVRKASAAVAAAAPASRSPAAAAAVVTAAAPSAAAATATEALADQQPQPDLAGATALEAPTAAAVSDDDILNEIAFAAVQTEVPSPQPAESPVEAAAVLEGALTDAEAAVAEGMAAAAAADLDAFDTAAKVAAARVQVESALAAARQMAVDVDVDSAQPPVVFPQVVSESYMVALSSRADEVLKSIDVVLSSIESDSEDEAAGGGGGLVPPLGGGVGPSPAALEAVTAADSSTGASLNLNIPPLPGLTSTPTPVSVPLPEPAAAAVAAVASALPPAAGEALESLVTPGTGAAAAAEGAGGSRGGFVLPSGGSVAEAVLERIRGINRLLEEEQQGGAEAVAAARAPAAASTAVLDPWTREHIVASLSQVERPAATPATISPSVLQSLRQSLGISGGGAGDQPPLLPPVRGAAGLLPAAAPAQATAAPAALPVQELPPPASLPPFQTQVDPLPATLTEPPPPPHPHPNKTLHKAAAAAAGGRAASAEADPYNAASLLHFKSGLLDLVYGTCRGVAASAAQRAGIDEFVCALEARNPHSAPTDAVSALAGRWKLVYTSNTATLLLLGALDRMPLVEVGDVCQEVDPVSLTATNKIDLAVPMPLSLRAESGLEVRSPRQFKVRFTRVGVDTFLETPQLVAALEIPPSISVLGATLDLTPLQRLVSPLNSGLEAAQGLLAAAAAPRLNVPEGGGSAASLWMLTTYLDDTLRVSRDDEGRVFIMVKDVAFPPL